MSGGPPYTKDEEKAILKYIIDNEAYRLLKGIRFWKGLEEHRLIDRTHQSMKEHYKKIIRFQLHYPCYGLDMDTRVKLKQGWLKGQMPIKEKPKPPNEDEFYSLDF